MKKQSIMSYRYITGTATEKNTKIQNKMNKIIEASPITKARITKPFKDYCAKRYIKPLAVYNIDNSNNKLLFATNTRTSYSDITDINGFIKRLMVINFTL